MPASWSSAPAVPRPCPWFRPDISIANGAVLAASGPYTTVAGWLNSGRIATASGGALAFTANSNETINLTAAGYTGLYLGSIGTNTYTGTLTPGSSSYLLGSAGGTLVMANSGALVDGSGRTQPDHQRRSDHRRQQ